MKSIVLSFDDGTIYDREFTALLDRYGIRATLNLNSGLDGFVWYYGDHPIERLKLAEWTHIFRNHEVASHTLTHPCLTELSREELLRQVNGDVENLSRIFDREIVSFGVPFESCNEEVIAAIRAETPIRYLRLSEFRADTKPADPYHIYINALFDDQGLYEALDRFVYSQEDRGIFVIAGHSYEFEADGKWPLIEKLLQYLSTLETVAVEPLRDACQRYFG